MILNSTANACDEGGYLSHYVWLLYLSRLLSLEFTKLINMLPK